MRVRVVLLDEDLVSRLEPYGGKRRVEIENGQVFISTERGERRN